MPHASIIPATEQQLNGQVAPGQMKAVMVAVKGAARDVQDTIIKALHLGMNPDGPDNRRQFLQIRILASGALVGVPADVADQLVTLGVAEYFIVPPDEG